MIEPGPIPVPVPRRSLIYTQHHCVLLMFVLELLDANLIVVDIVKHHVMRVRLVVLAK